MGATQSWVALSYYLSAGNILTSNSGGDALSASRLGPSPLISHCGRKGESKLTVSPSVWYMTRMNAK